MNTVMFLQILWRRELLFTLCATKRWSMGYLNISSNTLVLWKICYTLCSRRVSHQYYESLCLFKLCNLGNFLSHFVQLWRILWELIFCPKFLHNFFHCFVCHVKTTTDLQNIFLHKVFPTKLRVYNFADIFFHVVFNNSTEWSTPTGISDLEP